MESHHIWLRKWITGGMYADFLVTAVRTGKAGAGGISMMLIPRSDAVQLIVFFALLQKQALPEMIHLKSGQLGAEQFLNSSKVLAGKSAVDTNKDVQE